ncbi:MAG: HNH endonuclease [Acidobacteria bacterium]|nr:HNH endonuclease [Acidobacteriota bacterium]
MEHTLVLNASYEPLQIVSWKRAIRMLFQEKVEVVAEYDREIRSVTVSIKLPSVLRLLQYARVKRNHHQVKFTRSNLYARDGYRCQYCGERVALSELTYDHVIPVARGGGKTWENIVTCCIPCNRRKGDRTPDEAGLSLLREPKAPAGFPQKVHFLLYQKKAPESWRNYIFLNVGLSFQL